MRPRAILAIAIALAACTEPAAVRATPTPSYTYDLSTPVPTGSRVPADFTATRADLVDANCGSTAIVRGGIPDTLMDFTGYNAPTDIPYAVAHPAIAAGFIFGHPLHVRAPGAASTNKILWVVATRRTGDLVVDGTPLGRTAPTVHYAFPANSGPGEIYPSGVDVPEPGCWSFTLRWAGQTASIELLYR